MTLYGKHIKWSKKMSKRPSTQSNNIDLKTGLSLHRIRNGYKSKNQYGTPIGIPRFPINSDATNNLIPTVLQENPFTHAAQLANPFYNYLLDNRITYIKDILTSGTGTTTTINIKNTGVDRLLKKGDTCYIVNRETFMMKQLTCDEDLLAANTSLRITGTVFKKSDWYPSGSFIIADNKLITERATNAPMYKKFELTNAEYKSLYTSPYTLLAAETDKLHIPINTTIVYRHGADEMTIANFYIGHNQPATTVGSYWGSLGPAWYRSRDDMMFSIGAEAYGAGASGDFDSINTKCKSTNGFGQALTIYTSADFTSASSTIHIHLTYMTVM